MYLDQIVDFINDTVKLRMGSKASHARFYGVSKIVEKGEEKTVVLYDNKGNDILVQDDTYHFFCYHRFIGFSFQANEQNLKESYGDDAGTKTAFANFIMGVYGDRSALDMTDQELAASVAFNFPDVVPSSLTSQLTGVKKIIISPVSTNNQPTSEPISPASEDIFFTLSYRVAITGDMGCLSQCNPSCI